MKKLVKNARVFDGRHEILTEHASIVIDGDLVEEITQETLPEESFGQVTDAGNRIVIPGLVDHHVHLGMPGKDMRVDEAVVHGVAHAKRMLLNGFTTVRDAGGIVYGIKKGIDDGRVPGPRVFPSNAYISQTCGHGDKRESRAHVRLSDGSFTSPALTCGETVIADGYDEVLRATREQLFLGASQIKIMAGGGMSSQYDPIQTIQFTEHEMRAAVEAAADYGTYVMAHLYTKESMLRAARAGVKSFEHGQMLDEELAKIVRDEGIFLCVCPQPRADEEFNAARGLPPRKRKPAAQEIIDHEDVQTEMILKYDLPIIFGTDYVEFIADSNPNAQSRDLAVYEKRFGSFRGLVSATGAANDLIKLTTYQNPYPQGKIGLLEQGSFADLLIVDGDPIGSLSVLSNTENLRVIMKGGEIYKNTL